MSQIQKSEEDHLIEQLAKVVPSELLNTFTRRDGAKVLADRLPSIYTPKQIGVDVSAQEVWEQAGLFYFWQQRRRHFEALGIFLRLYEHMLDAQVALDKRVHKGMPLLWIAECYGSAGFAVLRKRFLMLALCEDAIEGHGQISAEKTGVYFRLVWRLGMTDEVLQAYAQQCYQLSQKHPIEARYPEWIIQELGQDWMTEIPTPDEANVYVVNSRYIRWQLEQCGVSGGKALERLAAYVMQCMPGCRTSLRKRTRSTDYDVVCSMDGFDIDFRSELGRYFVCECKDWAIPADFSIFAKFCRVLDSLKSRFGILFSQEGISGSGNLRYAAGEQMKVFQDRGIVIIAIDRRDLEGVAAGANIINILRTKYEQVRLDLVDSGDNPAESHGVAR